MKKILILSFVLIVGIIFAHTRQDNTGINLKSTAKNQDQKPLAISPDYGNIPLYFIPNKGQVDNKALFYARTTGYTLWMTKEGLIFDSIKAQSAKSRAQSKGLIEEYSGIHSALCALRCAIPHAVGRDVSRLIFIGANNNPKIVPVDITQHKVNCFIGRDKSKWQQDIPTSKAILYKNIYKNIDLKVYGIENQVEYDWIVKPGGNPKEIKFDYRGVKSIFINRSGDLIVKTKFAELIHKKPVSYQKVKARRQTGNKAEREEGNKAVRQKGKKAKREKVEAGFKKFAENTYGFSVGKYDKCRPLIIDPVVQLGYSTYLGGNRRDHGYAITVDSSGSAYITGETESSTFPTKNAFQAERMGTSYNVFLTKLTPGGNALEYSTYLGGSHFDLGCGIAVDTYGCTYITGQTYSKNFPTVNPTQKNHGGGHSDLFVCKLSEDGSQLMYSTYLGGNDYDRGNDIAVDSNGAAYVTGYTGSHNFPTKNSLQGDFGGGKNDAFVTKLSVEGSTLLYSTYLGGRNVDPGSGIDVDSNGCAYITGCTCSSDFPTKKPYQAARNGSSDAFITKLSSDGTSIIYSTYLGGSKQEGYYYWGTSAVIKVDSSGSAYVTGRTRSPDFPTKNPFQGTLKKYWDVYITKLTPDGTDIEYSTYLGGNNDDFSYGIAVDNRGCAYVTGRTYSISFPLKNAFQEIHKGYSDGFITKLSSSGSSLLYSTFLGGHDTDRCCCIAVDNNRYAYVTGYMYNKWGPDFPLENPFQKTYGGGYSEAFVTKLVDDFPPTVTIISPDNKAVVSGTVAIRAEAEDDVGVSRLDFYIDDELVYSDKQAPYEYDWVSFLYANGSYTIKAEAVDTEDHKTTAEINVTTKNIILTLNAERKVEQAWLIKKEYGKIDLIVKNPGNLVVKKYIIYRKEAGDKYQTLKEISASELSGGSYSFNDTYLEKDKKYYYKAEALDSSGDIVGISGEQSI